MSESRAAYYARREAEARALARQATDDGARQAHLHMAERYAELRRRTDDGPIPIQIVADR